VAQRSRDTKVLTLASSKGGSSRSLLAVHLSVYADAHGWRTVLVDTDPQQTASRWYDRRKSETPTLVTSSAGKLTDVIAAARRDGYALVVVDTPPHAAGQIDEAVRQADLVLVPCRPMPNDLDALPETVSIIEQHHVPAAFLLTAVPATGSEAAEARELFKSEYPKVPVCPVEIGYRKAFYFSMIDGRAVTEYDPESKASEEIAALWNWLRRTAAWPPPVHR
jgi:chromosome partitioning protein